ncbi:MAG: hypothetical protein JST75_21575 [Bacteroidetes bacterium]|nr:hypothetical protein [Bacteroidota bacterium]
MNISYNRYIRFVSVLVFLFFFRKNTLSQTDSLSIQLNNDILNHKIDSIKNILKADTSNTLLMFFNVDFMDRNAYGCVIFKKDNAIDGYKISFLENGIKKSALNHALLKSNKKLLEDFFRNPSDFLTDFPPKKKQPLSHDNAIYLFLKKDNRNIFDHRFMRSNSITTSNPNASKLITQLGAFNN